MTDSSFLSELGLLEDIQESFEPVLLSDLEIDMDSFACYDSIADLLNTFYSNQAYAAKSPRLNHLLLEIVAVPDEEDLLDIAQNVNASLGFNRHLLVPNLYTNQLVNLLLGDYLTLLLSDIEETTNECFVERPYIRADNNFLLLSLRNPTSFRNPTSLTCPVSKLVVEKTVKINQKKNKKRKK